MRGRPGPEEAVPYYFKYIDQVAGDDVLKLLEKQRKEMLVFMPSISEEKSLHRYGPDKWSIRQVLNHVNDCERLFTARAFWFARGFETPLPSFDQNDSAAASGADEVPWSRHIEEFGNVRSATLSFFRNMPEEAWTRTGVASGNTFSVRALAFIAAGHTAHHARILRESYL